MRKQFIRMLLSTLFVALLGGVIGAQNKPYRVTDRQVQLTLNSIEARTDIFRRELDKALDASKLDGTERENMIMSYVTDFENATDSLKQRFDSKKSVSSDVSTVLNAAGNIERFIKTNRLNYRARSYWNNVAAELDKLQRYYGLTGSWRTTIVGNSYQVPYRVSDSQVSNLLTSIETDTDIYKRSLNRALDRSTLDGTKSEESVLKYVGDFELSTDQLKQKFDSKSSVASDVQEVLNKAYFIDGFMKDYRLTNAAQRNWTSLKSKLDRLATYYSVAWNWTNPTVDINPYTASDQAVRSTLANIESRTDVFRRELARALDASVLNNSRSEEAVNAYVNDFEGATDRLKKNFESRVSTSADVQEVLNRAYYIDGFMRDYQLRQNAERDWRLIRADLEKLRGYYNVSFDWENRQYVPMSRFDAMLTGTYRLNTALSDNVSVVVDNAIKNYPVGQQNRYERNLERRLSSPAMIALEKRDKMVSLASSGSPQITFDADGITRNENLPNGRVVKLTANTSYNGVSLNYEGDRMNDFYVNFIPLDNNRLRVVRRVYLEDKNETVAVSSVYDKINDIAQWSTVTNSGNTAGNSYEDFVVPNNTALIAVLNDKIATETSKDGDVFTLTVTSPSQFNGTIISGRVADAERSGRVTGRANLSLEFDTIRLRNGKTYRFAGLVEEVKMTNGDTVSVNNEGTVRDGSQTTKTVTRAGIGAAIGAIIGAIASGGKGAAIGAAIGAGAGAGTVVLQGRDDINLEPGTEFKLTATAPVNTALNR
ncbi:MAG: hypothetical protein KIS76_15535 [Pyrinomonadaceae bacterium]|nr:hypothetical protein [Pyrinomonadaceae bacterium]